MIALPRRRVAVVPVFDGEALLEACLEALLASDATLELLVVDDASRDASLAVAARCAAAAGGRVRVVALDRNAGFAGAVNRGIAAIDPPLVPDDLVVLVNQDCIVRSGWLVPLEAALADASVAAAGARLLDSDGVTLQHAGARVEANGLTSHLGRGSRDPGAFRVARDVDYVCAAIFALRYGNWQRIGRFDEGYAPAYFEEVDWCRRAQAAGLRIVYVPQSEALHAEASTSRGDESLFLRRYHRSRMRFVARHLFGPAWLRAELAWMLRLRRLREIAPALAAWPRLLQSLAELASEQRGAVAAQAGADVAGRSGPHHARASLLAAKRSVDVAGGSAAGRAEARG